MTRLEEIGYSQNFQIRTSEIDMYKRIKLPSLVQLMQEASMLNAIKLKVSVWDLEDSHMSWVLVKKRLEIHRLPKLGEFINISTYPAGIEKLFAFRDFIVRDENQIIVAEASSSWVLIDTKTRKLIKPDFTIPIPNDVTPLERPKFKISETTQNQQNKRFNINWFDLDWNKHVNNVFLLRCLIEGTPAEILENKTVSKVNIQFKSEGLYGDTLISSCTTLDANQSIHSLIKESDNKVVAICEIFWK